MPPAEETVNFVYDEKQLMYDPNFRSCPGDVEIPNRVFVKGFPKETEEEELKAFFEIYGIIHDARIVRDTEGESKGYAFVTFDSQEIAGKVKEMVQIPYKDRELVIGPAKIRKKRPVISYGSPEPVEQYYMISQHRAAPYYISPDGAWYYQPDYQHAIPVFATNTSHNGVIQYQYEQSCYYPTSPVSTTVSQHSSTQQSLPLQSTPPQSTTVLQPTPKQATTQQHLQQQPQTPPTSQQQFPVKSEQQRTQVSQQSQQRLSSSQQKQQQPPPSQQLAKQTVDQSIAKTTIVHSKLQPVSSVTDLSMTTVAPVMTARPVSNVNNNTMAISSTPTTPAMNSYTPVYYTPVYMNTMTDAFNNMVIAEPQPYIASPQPTLISQTATTMYTPPTIYTASPVMQSQPMCVPVRYDGVMQQPHEDQKVTHTANGTSDMAIVPNVYYIDASQMKTVYVE